MSVTNDLFFGIAIGAAPIAAGLPATPHGGAIHRQPDTTGVCKGFVSLGPMHHIDQSLTRARRVQPLGEVAQSVVAETGLESQASGPSRLHQLFDGEEAGLAQPLSRQHSP